MQLIKKNLQTVKNKLLLELEDSLLDMMMSQMNAKALTKAEQEQMAQEGMKDIMNAVRDNAIRFTQICYTDEDGNDLTEETLSEIPLKMMLFKDALPEILEIVMGSMEEEETGKPQPRKRAGTRAKK